MTPKAFQIDSVDAACEVCGSKFNRKFGTEIAGKFVCSLCARYRHMVHPLRYVEYMASRDCQVVLTGHESGEDPMRWSEEYCRLDCGCDTCSARKVLRFIKQWHKAHGYLRT